MAELPKLSIDPTSMQGFRQALHDHCQMPRPADGTSAQSRMQGSGEASSPKAKFLGNATVDMSALGHWTPGLRGFQGRSLAGLGILTASRAQAWADPPGFTCHRQGIGEDAPAVAGADVAQAGLMTEQSGGAEALQGRMDLADLLAQADRKAPPTFDATEPEGPPRSSLRRGSPEAEAEISRVRSALEQVTDPQDGARGTNET